MQVADEKLNNQQIGVWSLVGAGFLSACLPHTLNVFITLHVDGWSNCVALSVCPSIYLVENFRLYTLKSEKSMKYWITE